MPRVVVFVEMHNVFKIVLVVLREALTIMLSTKPISEDVTIVQFHSYTRVAEDGDKTVDSEQSLSHDDWKLDIDTADDIRVWSSPCVHIAVICSEHP